MVAVTRVESLHDSSRQPRRAHVKRGRDLRAHTARMTSDSETVVIRDADLHVGYEAQSRTATARPATWVVGVRMSPLVEK